MRKYQNTIFIEICFIHFYRPHTKYDAKLMFRSFCPSVHMERGGGSKINQSDVLKRQRKKVNKQASTEKVYSWQAPDWRLGLLIMHLSICWKHFFVAHGHLGSIHVGEMLGANASLWLSVADPETSARGGVGLRNMKYKPLRSVAMFFMIRFYKPGGGGHVPLGPLPGSVTGFIRC